MSFSLSQDANSSDRISSSNPIKSILSDARLRFFHRDLSICRRYFCVSRLSKLTDPKAVNCQCSSISREISWETLRLTPTASSLISYPEQSHLSAGRGAALWHARPSSEVPPRLSADVIRTAPRGPACMIVGRMPREYILCLWHSLLLLSWKGRLSARRFCGVSFWRIPLLTTFHSTCS